MKVAALEEAHDAATFGGKASQLAVALGHRLPVPGGFALCPQMVEAVSTGNAAAIDRVRPILGDVGTCVAVRSSAIGEDGASASFAGQHATILHVLGLDHERLTFRHGGRDYRLTDVHGEVVKGVLA